MFSPTYRFLLSSPSLLCLFDSLLLPFAWAGGVWNKVNSLINQLVTTSGPAQPCTNTNHSEQTSFHCLPNHWAKENQFALETNFCFPDLLKFVNSAWKSGKSCKDVCKTSMLHSCHDLWKTSFYSPTKNIDATFVKLFGNKKFLVYPSCKFTKVTFKKLANFVVLHY